MKRRLDGKEKGWKIGVGGSLIVLGVGVGCRMVGGGRWMIGNWGWRPMIVIFFSALKENNC